MTITDWLRLGHAVYRLLCAVTAFVAVLWGVAVILEWLPVPSPKFVACAALMGLAQFLAADAKERE